MVGMWPVSLCSVVTTVERSRKNFRSWVHQAMIRNSTYIVTKHPHYLLILSASSTPIASSRESLPFGTDSQMDVSPISPIFNSTLDRYRPAYQYKIYYNISLYVKWPQALYRTKLTVKKSLLKRILNSKTE